jgi:hypothetical protein
LSRKPPKGSSSVIFLDIFALMDAAMSRRAAGDFEERTLIFGEEGGLCGLVRMVGGGVLKPISSTAFLLHGLGVEGREVEHFLIVEGVNRPSLW